MNIPGEKGRSLTLELYLTSRYDNINTIESQNKRKKIWSKTLFGTDHYVPLLRPPYFLLSVILINACVHFWRSDNLLAILEWSPKTWCKQPWRLITYGFIHTSVSHLAFNSLLALPVGWILEREQGWRRMICLWFGGLAAGALGSGVFQPKVHILGASAAVYSVITAHIPNVCLRYGNIPLWWFRLLSVLVLGTSEMFYGLTQNILPTGTNVAAQAHFSYKHVAWAAHVLGAAVGIPLAFIVFTGENYRMPILIACRTLSALLLVAGIVIAAVILHEGCGS